MRPEVGKQPPESESPATIRDRGAVGAVLLTIGMPARMAVAFVGTFVLAHLLSPTEIGMVAFGATMVTIGTFFADGGLGAALIRRADHPTVDELRTLLAMQLGLAFVIALAVAVVGIPGRHKREPSRRSWRARFPCWPSELHTPSLWSARSCTGPSRPSTSQSRSSTTAGRSRRLRRAGASGASPPRRSRAPSQVQC